LKYGAGLKLEPPFRSAPETLQVLLRIEDPSQTYVKQMTVSEIVRN